MKTPNWNRLERDRRIRDDAKFEAGEKPMTESPDKCPTPLTDAATHECRQYHDMGGHSPAMQKRSPDGECVDADFARELERELSALRSWKESALTLESTWDEQAVGKALNLPLGVIVRREILPAVMALKEGFRIQRDNYCRVVEALRGETATCDFFDPVALAKELRARCERLEGALRSLLKEVPYLVAASKAFGMQNGNRDEIEFALKQAEKAHAGEDQTGSSV